MKDRELEDLEAMLARARAAAEAGERPEAERIYRQLVATELSDPRPYCNLAVLALMEKRSAEAIPLLERAAAIDPDHARTQLNLGMALQLEERTSEAIVALRQAVRLDPQLAEAWNNLGYVLTAAKQPEEAMEAYRKALDLNPVYSTAAENLSRLLADYSNPTAAEAVLRNLPEQAITATVVFTLGEMLRLQGRFQEARDAYFRSMDLAPEDADLRLGVGQALISCGLADEAVMTLLPLPAMRPDDPLPLGLLAFSLQAIGEMEQAMELYQQVLKMDPQLLPPRNLLGLCYAIRGQHDLAIREFRAGLEVDPTHEDLRCNLAASIRNQGFLADSMAELDRLLEEIPDSIGALVIQLFNCSIGSESLAPRALELSRRYWQLVRAQPSGLILPAFGSQGQSSPFDQATSHEPARPVAAPTASLPAAPREDRRLRIGFLSAEIGNHVVGSFLSSFLEHYNRERFAVELFGATRRFENNAHWMVDQVDEHWLLQSMGMGEARALIQSRRIDVLVETSGFTADTAIGLLAERCAPIQCHYIGYHATTGLDTIDWFIGDAETVPEAFAPQFVERLWRLPRPWLARTPMLHPPEAISTNTDGIPVLGSFNQLAKLGEETLRYWAAALKAVPTAQVLVKDRCTADSQNCDRIRTTLAGYGVAPERITFLGYAGSMAEHLALYNQLDVALDATPWSSATTAFDALEMGVPLVAIRGGCTAARMSSGLLRGVNRSEWLAESPEQFAAIVSRLCSDLPALREGKQALRRHVLASSLFDPVHLCHALEQAFTAMAAGEDSPV